MNSYKLKKLFTLFLIVIVSLSGMYYKHFCDKEAARLYKQGVNLYNLKKYSDAYFNFKQIKKISNMHELSLLKQYQCANNLNDKKTTLIKLKEIIKTTKNKHIKPWAMYQEAALMEELKLSNKNAINKKYKYIYDNYPESNFGIASAYKTATLSKETMPHIAKESFLNYLSYAPTGKFSSNAAQELTKLKNNFSKEDYEIIADSRLANEQYNEALANYQKTNFSKNWYKISKCYRGLKDKEQEKATILKGLNLNISNVDEKDISNAIDRLSTLSNANKAQLLQELYIKYPNSYIFPTVLYKMAENSTSIRAIKLYELVANEYPTSIWASNALWEVFWNNYQQSRFKICENLARKHMMQYDSTQDAPRIAYWYGRALLKSRKNQQAREVFYNLINDYPLSYYSFLSAKQLKMSKAKKMILKKPIVSYDLNNLNKIIFQDKAILEIANLDDWELIDSFKINDEYIKAWIAYKKQNPTLAINIAKEELLKNKEENEDNDKEKKVTFSDQRLKLIYPVFYEKEINNVAQNLKQSPYLFLSLVREESHFDKKAKSSVGALGLSQLMPATANFITKSTLTQETLYEPNKNIEIGLKYFNYLVNTFNQNEYLAILAYNAGPGNIKKWLENPNIKSDEIEVFVENIPYLETKNYIKKILSTYWIYLNIYSSKNK